MGMGHQNFCDLLIGGNGRNYGSKMRVIIWARVDDGDVAQAQKIGICAGIGHGRRVWRHKTADFGGPVFLPFLLLSQVDKLRP